MVRFAMFTKLALLAAVVLSLLLGQPVYAQARETPPSTGKTLSAPLLGQSQPSTADTSAFAGQTVRIRIAAANNQGKMFSADVEVRQGGQGAGKVSYGDTHFLIKSGVIECTANGVVVILSGTRYREVGGSLVAEGDARIYARPAGGGGGDMVVFDIVDAVSQRTIEAAGEMAFSANPCP